MCTFAGLNWISICRQIRTINKKLKFFISNFDQFQSYFSDISKYRWSLRRYEPRAKCAVQCACLARNLEPKFKATLHIDRLRTRLIWTDSENAPYWFGQTTFFVDLIHIYLNRLHNGFWQTKQIICGLFYINLNRLLIVMGL